MSLVHKAEKRILGQSTLKGLVTPDYKGLGINSIVPTLLKGVGLPSKNAIPEEFFDYSLFNGIDNIVLLCVDGMGYSYLSKGFRKMDGIPITSVAPSTTTSAFPTISTGLTPQEHGIVGYWVYFRELGEVTSMLRFGPAMGMGSFVDAGIDPTIFFPFPGAYSSIKRKGFNPSVITRKEYMNSGLSLMIYQDVERAGHNSMTEMFAKGRSFGKKGKNFITLYWDSLDMLAHIHGTGSKQFREESEELCKKLDVFLDKSENTLLLLTSDHGHINCPENKQVSYIDHPDLLARLSVPPNGEGRFSLLFAKEGRKEKVKSYAEDNFNDVILMESKEAMKKGLLGTGKPNPETLNRMGDFVLIPKNNSVFTYPYVEGRGLVGFHGGLSREEMIVPLLWKRV